MYNWGSRRRFSRVFRFCPLTLKLGMLFFSGGKSTRRPSIIHRINFALLYSCSWRQKTLHTQFKGQQAILTYSWKSTFGPSVIHHFNLFVFLMSINSYMPNLKVNGQNWNFHENRPVDLQLCIVEIFRCKIGVQQASKSPRTNFRIFLFFGIFFSFFFV